MKARGILLPMFLFMAMEVTLFLPANLSINLVNAHTALLNLDVCHTFTAPTIGGKNYVENELERR